MWKILPVKAIRIHEDGGPEVLRYEDAPDPVPDTGQVLIGLRAASLNHLDIWIRKGLPSVAKPRILGADGAGVVISGDGFAAGDRVVINPGIDHGDGRVTALVPEGILRSREANGATDAEKFLFRARSAVHLETGRTANRLRRVEQEVTAVKDGNRKQID